MRLHLVSVPETSVYKNGGAIGTHHYVGTAGDRLHAQPVTVAMTPQPTPHLELGLGVAAVYLRHAAVTLIFS